jgi:hypothetical protein
MPLLHARSKNYGGSALSSMQGTISPMRLSSRINYFTFTENYGITVTVHLIDSIFTDVGRRAVQ